MILNGWSLINNNNEEFKGRNEEIEGWKQKKKGVMLCYDIIVLRDLIKCWFKNSN